MTNFLKSKIAMASVLTLAGLGQSARADWQYPFLAPDFCKNSVIQRPVGSSVFYRSENCSTVFVLPPQMGTIDYRIEISAITDVDCNDYFAGKNHLQKLDLQKEEIENKLYDPKTPADKIDLLSKQLASIQTNMEKLNNMQETLAGTEGANMTVHIASNHADEAQRFQDMNQLLFSMGTRFETAPVAESYVSFSSSDAASIKARKSAVVYSDIPGIEVRGVTSASGSASRILNGSATGLIKLGMNEICSMRQNQNVRSINDIRFTPSQLETFIQANLTYSVPVMSGYKYTAALDYNMVVGDWIKKWENNADQFTVTAFTDELLSGAGSKAVTWDFESLGLGSHGVSDADLREWEENVRRETFTNFTAELADALTQMGVLKKGTPTLIPAPKAGTVAETYWREVCEDESVLGVRINHSCWNEPYTVISLHAGSANNIVNDVRKLNLQLSETVKYRQMIYRTHTSTFKYRSMM